MKAMHLGQLGMDLGNTLLKRGGRECSIAELEVLTAGFESQVRMDAPQELRDTLGAAWGKAKTKPKPTEKDALASGSSILAPVLIRYDQHGNATNQQEKAREKDTQEEEVLQWTEVGGTAESDLEIKRVAYLHLLHVAHEQVSPVGGEKRVSVTKSGSKIKVCAYTLALWRVVSRSPAVRCSLAVEDRHGGAAGLRVGKDGR